MDDTQLKREIQKLVDEFRANHESYRKQLEANTETKLVEPLFKLLGWNTADFEKQAAAQRGQKSGHADYAFKINDKIVFFLEVKKVGIALDKEADKQVISYALSKRIPFAVSTNFEETKIFCVEQENAIKNVFRIFTRPEDYVSNLSDLKFLSKQSFEEGLTLKRAETEGRLKKRITIDKTLLDDLMHIRSLIASDIEKTYPQKYELNEKDEIVQRIIDRLIFIRRCEDIGINPNCALEEIKHLPDNKAYPKLKEIFKTYNDVYNSGLFAIGIDNDCDKISIDGSIIKKLVYYLYESKDSNYVYNFDWIDADVLGQVYEQYLGKILAQTKSGKSKLKEGQAHRKEQGIFYTPTYIVDYIIKNTVVELLKEKKRDTKQIKVLDPACGSGSFLIKAFDYLYAYFASNTDVQQKRLDNQGTYSFKTEILKNNIYGVDLDNKAVEITKLNLLLKAAEKERRLPPETDLHIRHGNSLVDDQQIAGLNAFKWENHFENGTFDAVVGNPPYVQLSMESKTQDALKNYLIKKYGSSMGRLNTFGFFIKLGIDLLKEHGLLGFIVPNTILTQDYYEELREMILNSCKIEAIVNFTDLPFKEAVVENVILILRKDSYAKARDSNKVSIFGVDKQLQFVKKKQISQQDFLNNNKKSFNIFLDKSAISLREKLSKNAKPLGALAEINQAIALKHERTKYLSKTKVDGSYKPVLDGRNINRYSINWDGWYLRYDIKAIHSCKREDIFLSPTKLFFRRVGDRLIAALDNQKFYALNTLVVINKKPDMTIDIRCLLGIFNSKLINYYYQRFLKSTKKVFSEIQARQIKNLPIKEMSETQQKSLIHLVDKMIVLNKRLVEIGDKQTTEKARMEEEVKKTDTEIDEIVYKIYGITEAEKTVIETNLK